MSDVETDREVDEVRETAQERTGLLRHPDPVTVDPFAPSREDVKAAYKAYATYLARVQTPEKNREAKIQHKDGRGGTSFKYAELSSCMAVVRKAMDGLGLFFVQDYAIRGGRQYIQTRVLHEAGVEVVTGGWWDAGPPGGDPKQVAGNTTYYRRYSLCTACGIAAEEDTDADGLGDRAPRNPPPAPPRRQPPPAKPKPSAPPPAETGETQYDLDDDQRVAEIHFLSDLSGCETEEDVRSAWTDWKPKFQAIMSETLVRRMHGHIGDRLAELRGGGEGEE